MNAREMNKKANAYLEFVAVDYFNNTMLPKIEERADWGHFFATFYAKYDSDVARAKDHLIGYCESLGFEVQYELTTNHKCFTVSWEHATEDDVEYDKPIIFVDEELPYIVKTYEANVRYWGCGISNAWCRPRFEAADEDMFRAWVVKDFETNYPEFDYEILDVYEVDDEEEVIYVEKYEDFFDVDEEDIII